MDGSCAYCCDVLTAEQRYGDQMIDSQEAAELRRAQLLTNGQELNFVVGRLDHALRPLRSGRLIRAVFEVQEGALFYYSTVEDEYLVGARLDRTGVEDADRAMAELSERLRIDSGWGGAINYGSYADEFSLGHISMTAEEPRYNRQFAPHADRALMERCLLALDRRDLHYFAYFEGPDLIFAGDIFDNEFLAQFFTRVTPASRRLRYLQIGRLLYTVIAQLSPHLGVSLGGGLYRTVLDVEAGALYYLRISDTRSVIGVTLDQSSVAAADQQVEKLAGLLRGAEG
ncbi:hypothetical protein DPM19_13615 [Actinomadura craniellae]|uniref:Uncharacterized protein n=1 Tax=Actinomadura craniellae TaxID=2231787 RepID=A0A365H6Z8_9ACTN|nr:hypothetical protein DPM19_13615 [Actinomadura craniellae]